MRGRAELEADLRLALGEGLARAQDEGHARPAVVVDVERDGRKGGGLRWWWWWVGWVWVGRGGWVGGGREQIFEICSKKKQVQSLYTIRPNAFKTSPSETLDHRATPTCDPLGTEGSSE